MSRKRNQFVPGFVAGGSVFRVTDDGERYSVQQQNGTRKGYEFTWDTVHSGPPFIDESKLDKSKTVVEKRPRLTVLDSATGRRRSENWDPVNHDVTNHLNFMGPVSVQSYVNSALARLNPNVPDFDAPLFLYELREFPRMLKSLGDWLSRPRIPDIAGSNLAYQFGWRPLFSDLATMVGLTRSLEEARKEIEDLAKPKHRSTTGRLASLSWSSSSWNAPQVTLNPYETLKLRAHYDGTREVWFSARILPDFTAPFWGESQADTIARITGTSGLSASTIWNAIPWSWLIDYFGHVATYLEANRGQLPYAIRNMCIMVEDDMKKSWSIGSAINMPDSFYEFQGGSFRTVRKRRWVYPVPKARIAFRLDPITNGRLSILSSLFIKQVAGRL